LRVESWQIYRNKGGQKGWQTLKDANHLW